MMARMRLGLCVSLIGTVVGATSMQAAPPPPIHVDESQTSGTQDGSSWQTAYKYLQDALAAATPEVTIKVAKGTYRPDDSNANPATGDRTASFVMLPEVEIEGGYQGILGLPDNADVRNTITYESILSGEIGVVTDLTDNSLIVVKAGTTIVPVDARSILNGLTISGGYHFLPEGDGAGIVVAAGSSPRFEFCTIKDNQVPLGEFGGGVFILGDDIVDTEFFNCVIEDNIAGKRGGGVYVSQGSRSRFEDCKIHNNTLIEWIDPIAPNCSGVEAVSIADGAGFFFDTSTNVTMLRCEITENDWIPEVDACAAACNGGGGASFGTLLMRECLVSGNTIGASAFHGGNGGGLHLTGDAKIVNCDIHFNTVIGKFGTYGGGISAAPEEAAVRIVNCDIFGNSASLLFTSNTAFGGGIHTAGVGLVELTNLRIHENNSDNVGGAITIASAGTSITNCTISKNTAEQGHGGVYYFAGAEGASPIRNSILWGNTDLLAPGSIPTWNNQIFHESIDPPSVTYSCIQDDVSPMNPFQDPSFKNITEDPLLGGNLDIPMASPCVDSGSSPEVPDDATDVDNDADIGEQTPLDIALDPRFRVGAIAGWLNACVAPVDMGAFEVEEITCDDCIIAGDINYDGLVNGLDVQPFADCFLDGNGGNDCGCQCGDYVGNNGVDILDVPAFVQCLLGSANCPLPTECEQTGAVRSGLQDCNLNGVNDEIDVLQCDPGAEPGLCDCNDNGIPDECDIANETSADANENSIPDECEPDCNSNGVPDDKDIADATSADCDTNGVPDECDQDCNGNETPDACETIVDCNANGILDACEVDCDNDGIPNACELSGNDCNGNNEPDDCEIDRSPPWNLPDCNNNDVPDECELSGNDCNSNGVLDECDIANQVSDDVNENGIPDECESQQQMMGGGGGSSPMMAGAGSSQSSAQSGSAPLTEAEAWAAYFSWCTATDFSSMNNAAKFSVALTKRLELGLPAGQMLP